MSQSKVESAVSAWLAQYPPPNRFLVAFSGGMDSVVLLDALSRVLPPNRLRAVYIHHGLQPEASDWQDFTADFCRTRGIEYQSVAVQVATAKRQGLEALARAARYQALYECLDAQTILLTAHHLRDQAETFLLNALRGCGLSGLAAMPSEKTVRFQGRVHLHARPLLYVPYSALQFYAQQYSLTWVADPSNSDPSFRRNFIRHRVWPHIDQAWPKAEKTLGQTIEHLSESVCLLDALAKQDLDGEVMNAYQLSLEGVSRLGALRVKNALRYWAREVALNVRLNETVYAWVLQCLQHSNPESHPRLKQAGMEYRWHRNQLYAFSEAMLRVIADADYRVVGADFQAQNYYFSHRLYQGTESDQAWLNARLSSDGAWVRAMKPEDVQRLGLKSRLKKWFQRQGVPPWDRRRWPLLEKDGEIIAVLGGVEADLSHRTE